jgi:hypothetical protein
MTLAHRSTSKSTTAPEPTALSPGSGEFAGGAFERLNPADGLFLRADHLKEMQQYTSDLAAAVGAGLGPGVASGFKCTLSENHDAVQVTGGLAFAQGQPLRSTQMATVSLKELSPAATDFWVVEIVAASWPFGSEPVYGGLCEDPCGKGSGIHPFTAEGIELRLRNDTFPNFGDGLQKLRRNRLASYYFERERKYGGESSPSPNAPWLLPINGQIGSITEHPWPDGTGSWDDAAVPLGVVWKDGEEWQLDVWTARRDLGDPTPAAAWQWRLGWRPRSVFIAQVLQFQAQLADVRIGERAEPSANQKKAVEYIEAIRKRARAEKMLADLADCARLISEGEFVSLVDLGFDELPPAGYLPFKVSSSIEEMQQSADELFGSEVEVVVRECRADYVAHAVEEAQHMDRIPLDAPLKRKPRIDLLVPRADLVDLVATNGIDSYRWAAFVRHRDDQREEPPRDRVDVFLWTANRDEMHMLDIDEDRSRFLQQVVDQLADQPGQHDKLQALGSVSYPQAEWGVPVDERKEPAWQTVHKAVNTGKVRCAVLGVASAPDRQSLAAARATLFVAPQRDDPSPASMSLPPAYVAVAPKLPAEAIVVIVVQDDG